MSFVLVITTFNRKEEFNRLIKSLCNQNMSLIKRIIIIDQSDDDTFVDNKSLLKEINSSVDTMHIKVDKTSLSNARNQALKYINSDDGFLCFPDDDCWYHDDFFEQIFNIFEDNAVDIIQTYYREPETEGRKPLQTIITCNNVELLQPCSVGIFINLNNISIDEVFFDEMLGVGTGLPGGEESDLLFRLLAMGYKIKQVTEPYVYHKLFRERLKKPSYKLHAARFYVLLKNKNLLGIKKRMIYSSLKSIVVLPINYRNFFGKAYAVKLWIKR